MEGHSNSRGKTRLPMQVSRDHQRAETKAPGADFIYCHHDVVWIGVRMPPSHLLSGLMFIRRLFGRRLLLSGQESEGFPGSWEL